MFIRYISHEMRTPLNTALMGLRLLKKEVQRLQASRATSLMTETVVDVESSCSTAVGILDELLDFEKLDAGLMTLHKEHIPIGQLTRTIFDSFRVFAVEKDVELSLNLHSSVESRDELRGYAVTADKSKLSQVLRNMLSNALKFTPPGGKVVMEVLLETSGHPRAAGSGARPAATSARSNAPMHSVLPEEQVQEKRVVVRVTDTGPGIAKVSRLHPYMSKPDAPLLTCVGESEQVVQGGGTV